jgi:branched-chain amino acid transport system ATP-binding protein
VLHGVHFDVQAGEIVALLGRNGSGRSTTAKAIMGLVDWQGTIEWKGQNLAGKGLRDRPPGPGLCAREPRHLSQADGAPEPAAGPKGGGKAALGFDDMYAMFPRLKERQHTEAGVMSGGEQQMLTLCRTLMGDPDLIIIDEPTEGLAPKIVELVGEYLQSSRSAACRCC